MSNAPTPESAAARLILFVAGDSPRSVRARHHLRAALTEMTCDASWEEIDVLVDPARTLEHGVFATPALIVFAAGRSRVLYGDLSDSKSLTLFLRHQLGRTEP